MNECAKSPRKDIVKDIGLYMLLKENCCSEFFRSSTPPPPPPPSLSLFLSLSVASYFCCCDFYLLLSVLLTVSSFLLQHGHKLFQWSTHRGFPSHTCTPNRARRLILYNYCTNIEEHRRLLSHSCRSTGGNIGVKLVSGSTSFFSFLKGRLGSQEQHFCILSCVCVQCHFCVQYT